MGETLDDRALVERILSGERDLFSDLVRRYEKRILNYVYRIIHRYEDAHDLTQEIFIKVFMALDRYDPKYQFSTWIFRIAQNSAIDALRKRSLPEVSLTWGGPEEEGDGKEREVVDAGVSPYRDLKNKELSAAIDSAVEVLPEDYRELIQLRHFGELSYEEIAEMKKMPLGTVKNKLFRARNMLKDALGIVSGATMTGKACDEFLADPAAHELHTLTCDACSAAMAELEKLDGRIAAAARVEASSSTEPSALPLAPWEGAEEHSWGPVIAVWLVVAILGAAAFLLIGISPVDGFVAAVLSSVPGDGIAKLVRSAPVLLAKAPLRVHVLIFGGFVVVNVIFFRLLRKRTKGYDAPSR